MVNSINSNYRELPQQHRQDAPPIPTEDLQNDPHEMKNLYDDCSMRKFRLLNDVGLDATGRNGYSHPERISG